MYLCSGITKSWGKRAKLNSFHAKYLFLFFILISMVLSAQSRIDSLNNLLHKAQGKQYIDLQLQLAKAYQKIDSSEISIAYSKDALKTSNKINYIEGKIKALNLLANINIGLEKPSIAIDYLNKALKLAEKNHQTKLKADALRYFASASFKLGKKDTAVVKYKEALEIYTELKDSLKMGSVFSELGEVYSYLNDTSQMIESYNEALEIYKKLGNQKLVGLIYLNLGSVYSNLLGEYSKAIEYGFNALEIFDRLGDDLHKTYCYLIIGSAHEYLGNLDKALEQYKKSLELCSKSENNYLLANVENYIGEVYNKKHDIESALDYYSKSLSIYSELKSSEGIAVEENNIGECYFKLDELDKALAHYQKSFEYFSNRGEKFQLSELLVNMGNVYCKRNDYNSAINTYEKAISYAKETNALESLKDAYHAISHAYKKMQLPERALNYLESYIEIKDSLLNLQNLALLAEYDAKYEATQKEKKIALLKKEQEFAYVNSKMQKLLIFLLIAITVLLITTLVIYYRKYRQKNILNQKLAESEAHLQKINYTKDKFFSIIAHDLRGPLGTLSGLTEILDEDAEEMDKESIVALSKDIHKISTNTINLLNNLLTWASVQIGKVETSKENFDVKQIIEGNYELLKENLNRKNIDFINKISESVFVYADKNMISSVIRNLIHNAIKFTHKNGSITASYEQNNGHVAISISDTGVGIPQENLENLFEIGSKISTYGTDNEMGTGLGLILSKEFIEKNNGSIEVISQIGKGTTFIIKLPYSKN